MYYVNMFISYKVHISIIIISTVHTKIQFSKCGLTIKTTYK